MAISPALALGALEFGAFAALQSIISTSPRRQILWNAQDASGNLALDSNGQPLQNTLFPQVVVEERHFDQLRITQHPVEQGAAITDHAYKVPAQVQIRGGWSFAAASPAISLIPVPTDISFLQRLYGVLLTIQAQRSFVTLITGKRLYQNMLLETLSVLTDERNENVLTFVANFQEVLLATTQTVTVPDASVMKSPQINAAEQSQGQTSLLPGSNINVASANTAIGLRPGPGQLGIIQ